MTALTDQRLETIKVDGTPIPCVIERSIRNGSTLYKGGYAAADVAGKLVPAGDANAVTQALGVLTETLGFVPSLTGVADGSVTARLRVGVFWFANSSGGAAITAADLFGVCYAVDDQTVAKSDGNGSRLPAGIVYDIDATLGVAVQFAPFVDLVGGVGAGVKRVAGTIGANGSGEDYELTAAGLTQTVNVGSPIPATAIVISARAKLDAVFANGAAASLAMELGHDGDPDAYEDGFDVFTGSAHDAGEWQYETGGQGSAQPPATTTAQTRQMIATFTQNADQLVNTTGGPVHVEFLYLDVPSIL
jgi:hypothetical protein